MQLPLLLTLAGLVIADNTGGIKVDFDKSLEGRIGIKQKVEESVGELFVEAQFSKPKETVPAENALDARSLMSPNPALDVMQMSKRQTGCDSGYWYCSCEWRPSCFPR